MNPVSRATASVVAAGIVAITGGAFAAISVLFFLFAFSSAKFTAPGAPIPASIRPLLYLVWIFFLCCDVFTIFVGAELIRLRNWARIALLVVAGCLLFFGVIGIGVIFFTIFVTPVDPAVSKSLLASVLACVYGIPTAVALWWLILLTRRSVVQQFQPSATRDGSRPALPPASASLFNNPRCPLAVRIVGWYLASFLLFLPIIPFLPIQLPTYYFGHQFRGPSATLALFLSFAFLSIPGVGLLLLKRWSFPLTIASQLIFCGNSLSSAFSPSFEAVLRETFVELHLPDLPVGLEQTFHYVRYFTFLALIVPAAIIVALLLSRRSFYAAAGARASGGSPSFEDGKEF